MRAIAMVVIAARRRLRRRMRVIDVAGVGIRGDRTFVARAFSRGRHAEARRR
jgi:hypothetical protein